MGVSPYSFFLDVFLHQSPAMLVKLKLVASAGEISLPPTYVPPETTPAIDATFYYVIGGMTLMAAAFGNLIILNFVSTTLFIGYNQFLIVSKSVFLPNGVK